MTAKVQKRCVACGKPIPPGCTPTARSDGRMLCAESTCDLLLQMPGRARLRRQHQRPSQAQSARSGAIQFHGCWRRSRNILRRRGPLRCWRSCPLTVRKKRGSTPSSNTSNGFAHGCRNTASIFSQLSGMGYSGNTGCASTSRQVAEGAHEAGYSAKSNTRNEDVKPCSDSGLTRQK
jgi:hypothetical protein